MTIRILICALLLPWLIISCTKSPDTSSLEKELADTRAGLTDASREIEQLKSEVKDLGYKIELQRMGSRAQRAAYLTPGTDGYSPVTFDLGIITVQLADVTPYANGSRVILRFGNTLSSSINGLHVNIAWGKDGQDGLPDTASEKEKEMTFSQTMRAGAWTSVPVVLEGVPPTNLSYVRVSDITHTGIQLFR